MGTTPPVGTLPTVGFRPTTPFTEAGQMMEPSVSVPTARGARPAASAAPDPDEEPPALRSSAHGFPTRPPVADQPLVERSERMFAHSERLVLARITAPARRSRVTRGASDAGRPIREVDPAAPGRPVTSMLSLTTTGTPWSGPRSSPRARSASRWAATSSASAASRVMARSPISPAGSSITAMRPSRSCTSDSLVRVPSPRRSRISPVESAATSADGGWGSDGTTAG